MAAQVKPRFGVLTLFSQLFIFFGCVGGALILAGATLAVLSAIDSDPNSALSTRESVFSLEFLGFVFAGLYSCLVSIAFGQLIAVIVSLEKETRQSAAHLEQIAAHQIEINSSTAKTAHALGEMLAMSQKARMAKTPSAKIEPPSGAQPVKQSIGPSASK